jgi:LemA protein
VRNYNERVQSFPSNLVANGFHFEEEEFFEVDEGIREAGPPQVNFTDSSRPSTSLGGDVGSPTGTPPSTGAPPEPGGPLPPVPPPTGT